MKEINLNNPIFVYYFDHQQMPRQRVEEAIIRIRENMSSPNITLWIVPAEYTKVDCIYEGLNSGQGKVKKIYKAIKKILDKTPSELLNQEPFLEFRQEMRNILMDDIFEDVEL